MEQIPAVPAVNAKEDVLTVANVVIFCRKYGKKILVTLGSSLILMCVLFALIWCFCPRKTLYNAIITIELDKQEEQYFYPSGKVFSASDLISPMVMKAVYQQCNLQKRVSFEKFCAAFFVVQTDRKLAALDALYAAKMNKRNISLVELKNIEKEYNTALASYSSNQLILTLVPGFSVSRQDAARILGAIPETWYRIFSKIEAAKFPQLDVVHQANVLRSSIGQDGNLILLEKARRLCAQIIQGCDMLEKMIEKKNVKLPTGESLTDVRLQLEALDRYQIRVLQYFVVYHSGYMSPFDQIFLQSNLRDIENELQKNQKKYDGLLSTLQLIVARNATGSMESGKPESHNINSAAGNLTLQVGGEFLNSITTLIRNAEDKELRAEYAKRLLACRDRIGELEAEKIRYETLLKNVHNATDMEKVLVDKQTLAKRMNGAFSELFLLAAKLVQFQNLIVNDYFSSRSFCSLAKDIRMQQDMYIPFKRVALGLFILWLLGNLGYVGILWVKAMFFRQDA